MKKRIFENVIKSCCRLIAVVQIAMVSQIAVARDVQDRDRYPHPHPGHSGLRCEQSYQCPGRLSCIAGFCQRNDGRECVSNQDCRPGLSCDGRYCVPEMLNGSCREDSDCGPGQECGYDYHGSRPRRICKAVTAPMPTGPSCSRDQECAIGEVCRGGYCASNENGGCERETQCPEHQTCRPFIEGMGLCSNKNVSSSDQQRIRECVKLVREMTMLSEQVREILMNQCYISKN